MGTNFSFRSSILRLAQILIGDDLNKFALTHNCDTTVLEWLLDFLFQIDIIKGSRVDPGHVFIDGRISINFVDVTSLAWDSQRNTLGLNTTVEQALNQSVSIQWATIHNSVCLATSVCQLAHEISFSSKEFVQVRIIVRKETSNAFHSLRNWINTLRYKVQSM